MRKKYMVYSIPLRLFLFSILCFIAQLSFGQKIEIKANAYSGLFFFRGNGSVSTSMPAITDIGIFTAPYGRKSAFSYSLELQAQRITKSKLLYGAGLTYENLKSKSRFDSANTDIGGQAIEGKTILVNEFITTNPFIGRRFKAKNISFDVLVGVDIAFGINVVKEFHLSHNETYKSPEENYQPDWRPRMQLNVNYKRYGVAVGYSMGTRNLYHSEGIYKQEVYANYIRLGVSYKLK